MDGYIYFDENKNAYGFPIEGAVARVEKEVWDKYSNRSAGDGWDIVGRAFVLTIQPEGIDIENAKLEKRLERNKLCPEVAKFHQQTLFSSIPSIHPKKSKQDEPTIASLF